MNSEEKIWRTIDIDRRSLLHSLHESNSLTPDLIREINSQ
jgi:hypothetical protein